jgi:Fe-S-cluster containining protein
VCGRCCAGKVIFVGPHEVLGMARHLGISTTEFLSLYTEHGGTALRFGEDARCVFVGPSGCGVHPCRPLVCRLYPLGRQSDAEGEERFALYAADPGCEAVTGGEGKKSTVGEFLESQGAGPYIEWARRYGDLYKRMIGILGRSGQEHAADDGLGAGAEDLGGGPEDAPDTGEETDLTLSSWQDIDASLAGYCSARGLPVPSGIEESIDLHIRAMEEWLDELETGLGNADGGPES